LLLSIKRLQLPMGPAHLKGSAPRCRLCCTCSHCLKKLPASSPLCFPAGWAWRWPLLQGGF